MNKNFVRILIIGITLACFSAEYYFHSLRPAVADSHPSTTAAYSHTSPDYEATIVRGEVLGRDDRTIIVRTEDAIENITIHDYANVTRNTFEASVHHIRANDVVAIYMTGNHIRSVNVVTGTFFSGLKTAGMSFGALFLLLGIGFAVLRHMPKSFIRPTITQTA